MKIRIFQIDHEKNENKLAFMNYDTVPRRREPVYIPSGLRRYRKLRKS